jgi:ApbE superfamily uncharacterized protein (UPF0280 family)
MSAVAALLLDGRLHLQHGPIDCLCRAWGEPPEVHRAYDQATQFFATVLDDLCAELALLRAALPAHPPSGRIARAMYAACMPFADRFITPMAAVAGAVADGVLAAMVEGRDVARAFVNNGGDIAFHLAPGSSLRCGLVTDLGGSPRRILPLLLRKGAGGRGWCRRHTEASYTEPPTRIPLRQREGENIIPQSGLMLTPIGTRPPITNRELDGTFLLTSTHPGRGLATSGRACKGHGGRSFSFGIADAVTVLARTAAQADAAATIIGNAVDLPGHHAIDRRPASEIDPASDLHDRLITFDVGPLSNDAIGAALNAGETMVDRLLRNGLIEGAVLALRGHLRIRHASLALSSLAPRSLEPA